MGEGAGGSDGAEKGHAEVFGDGGDRFHDLGGGACECHLDGGQASRRRRVAVLLHAGVGDRLGDGGNDGLEKDGWEGWGIVEVGRVSVDGGVVDIHLFYAAGGVCGHRAVQSRAVTVEHHEVGSGDTTVGRSRLNTVAELQFKLFPSSPNTDGHGNVI